MRRLLPFLVIPLLALLAPAADAATCRSGETVYKKQGVRVFTTYRAGEDYYYACGPRTRKPVLLEVLAQAYGGLGVFGRSGDKVLWDTSSSGEGGGDYGTVGWFDVKTSEVRTGDLAGEVGNDVLDVVVAANGSVGVAVATDEDEGGVRVGYLARGSKRGTLRGERVLASAGEGYLKRSLAFADADRTLAWNGGIPRRVPIGGEQMTCTAGTTLAEAAGARVFEVIHGRKAVLAACAAGEAAPRRLGTADVAREQWDLRSLKRAGARIGFLVGDNGVGLLDGGQVRFLQPAEIPGVWDVAIGSTGPLAFAGYTARSGGIIERQLIARMTDSGWEQLATQGGTLQPGTLAVGDDGRVTWQTFTAQSTPLAGETTVDCTTGTTLIAHDGLRVFELLLAGANDARLLACPPGATAPVPLLTGPRATSWSVSELGRENGRLAIHAAGGGDERVFSLDADDAAAGIPKSAYGDVKDVALAPDGRMAFALRSSGKWKVVAFAPGGAERTLAKPSDGVQAGSLAIDGARVVWKNSSGAERSAAL